MKGSGRLWVPVCLGPGLSEHRMAGPLTPSRAEEEACWGHGSHLSNALEQVTGSKTESSDSPVRSQTQNPDGRLVTITP